MLVAFHDVFVKIFSVQASSCQGYIWGCGVTQVPTDLTTTCAEAAAATSLVPDKKRPTRCPARFTLSFSLSLKLEVQGWDAADEQEQEKEDTCI